MHGYQTSNNGIKEPTHGCENCTISQILIFDIDIDIWRGVYFRIVIWVHIILNLIDTRFILPRYKGSCMVYKSSALKTKNTCQIPIPY